MNFSPCNVIIDIRIIINQFCSCYEKKVWKSQCSFLYCKYGFSWNERRLPDVPNGILATTWNNYKVVVIDVSWITKCFSNALLFVTTFAASQYSYGAYAEAVAQYWSLQSYSAYCANLPERQLFSLLNCIDASHLATPRAPHMTHGLTATKIFWQCQNDIASSAE